MIDNIIFSYFDIITGPCLSVITETDYDSNFFIQKAFSNWKEFIIP